MQEKKDSYHCFVVWNSDVVNGLSGPFSSLEIAQQYLGKMVIEQTATKGDIFWVNLSLVDDFHQDS